MKHHEIKTLEEIKKQFHAVGNVNEQYREKLSSLDRLALWITVHIGSMGFFLIIFCWTACWLLWNMLAPIHLRFDPYPAFVLWLFISNMIQIFLMPLIMVGQNLQGRHSELRAEQDYKINQKSETEIETLIQHMENLSEEIDELKVKLENMQS
ncbi:MAG: hypothetical protein STSR0006_02670 [Lentimicrobium sp.]